MMRYCLFFVIATLFCYWQCTNINADVNAKKEVETENALTWNPHAGVIPSFTDSCHISTTSGKNANFIIDGNRETGWVSAPALPNEFVKNPQSNVLHGLPVLSSSKQPLVLANDGDLSSSEQVQPGPNPTAKNALLTIDLPKPTAIAYLSIKAKAQDTIFIQLKKGNGQLDLLGVYTPKSNFKWIRQAAKTVQDPTTQIKLTSKTAFDIFEIAALKAAPQQSVVLDLKQIQSIAFVDTRHWSTDATKLQLFTSTDSIKWTWAANLNPQALHKINTQIKPPQQARYLKLVYTLKVKDWAKASLYEIDVYDRHGPFGPLPPVQANKNSIAQMLGINTIWGWGHDKSSDELAVGQGPTLFKEWTSDVRNYHNMWWDTPDPDSIPNYKNIAQGISTTGNAWANWDKEYGVWQQAGLQTQASIQFEAKRLPVTVWDNPYKAAYNYGYAFAEHFGTAKGNGLVNALEVGNEPWKYPAGFYLQVLAGMSKGVKAADPNMQVWSCALQATYPEAEKQETGEGNYLGARINAETAPLLAGLNVHHYSYCTDSLGQRIAVHPEHPRSEMWGVLNDIRFRNANMPNKKIFVTEWGWDSEGANEPCTHGECVSEYAQAIYAIRNVLLYARLGVDKMHWFFYANLPGGSSLYRRSGVLGSLETNFEKKQAFTAMQCLATTLGDLHFLEVVQEDENAYIYLFTNNLKSNKPTHLIAWQAQAVEESTSKNISFKLPYQPSSAKLLDASSIAGKTQALPSYKKNTWNMNISTTPVLIELAKK